MTAPRRVRIAGPALAALCLSLLVAGDAAARSGSTYGRSYAPRTPSYAPRVRSYTPRTPNYAPSPYVRTYPRKAPGYVSPTPSHTPRLPGYTPSTPNTRRYIVPNPDYSPHGRSYTPGVARDEHGRIKRSEAAKREFMKESGYPNGRPGYVIDHIVPLARGGADAPSNMQWQTIEEAKAKDKVELGQSPKPQSASHKH